MLFSLHGLLLMLAFPSFVSSELKLDFSTQGLPVYQRQDRVPSNDQPVGRAKISSIRQGGGGGDGSNDDEGALTRDLEDSQHHPEVAEAGDVEWNRGAVRASSDHPRVNNETLLIKDLFSNYDNVARPVLDMRKSVQVEFGFRLLSIQMDEVNQLLTSFVWMPHRWLDERLTWEPDQYGNIEKIIIPNRMLWLPDTFLYQSSADTGYVVSFDRVPLEYTGMMEWWPSATLLSPCIIDVTYFPFDYQSCNLTLGPWGYHSDQVNYTLMDDHANLERYTVSGSWELVDTLISRNIVFYEDLGMSYTLIDITINLRRKALYYWLNVIIPCLLLNSLGIGLFMLPADSGEKVGFGLGILLTVFVFAILVNENIPKTSDYTPIIGIYLVIIMCMISLSLFLAIIIVNLHHRRPKLNAPPPWVRKLFLEQIPKVMGYELPLLPLFTGFTMQGITPKRKKRMRMMRRLRKQFSSTAEETAMTSGNDEVNIPLTPKTTAMNGSPQSSSHVEELPGMTDDERLEAAYKNMPFDEKYNDEWILVALVMDRVLLWGFLLLLIFSSSIVLVIVPSAQPR